jgi:hypothetical protein
MDEKDLLISKLRDALEWFTDDDPCEFDHHGYCQTHGSLHDGPCGMRVAIDLIELVDKEQDA